MSESTEIFSFETIEFCLVDVYSVLVTEVDLTSVDLETVCDEESLSLSRWSYDWDVSILKCSPVLSDESRVHIGVDDSDNLF